MSIIRVVKKNLPCEGVWSWQETYIGGGKSLSQRQIPAVKSVFWLLVITHPGALSCHVAPSLASLVTGTASKDLFTALTPQGPPASPGPMRFIQWMVIRGGASPGCKVKL
ncbi:hypothetical protein Y1Q_0013779 [Alligator mississippiensis]|uniref:Uncharacterized protein n=1 Tax=Alligator mississippiensis TaxID=8496 RepID=A0A151MMJ9_ALLMI|nr:hypothetical protein Y1Q_0013779 [Alligator mississippiensis]